MDNYKSTELNELFSALSKAQEEIRVAQKDSSNPFFKSSYANLQSVIESSRHALCKNGLSVSQLIEQQGLDQYMRTVLGHSSGQWLSSCMRLSPVKPDPQSLGSYITYVRRYSYAAIVGVYDGEEDDDGHKATHEHKQAQPKIDIVKLVNLLGSKPHLYDAVLARYGLDTLENLKDSNISDAIQFVQNQK